MLPTPDDLQRLTRGTSVQLVPVAEGHYEYLRRAEIEMLGIWWRNRSIVQSPAEFERRIWSSTLVQFVAVGLQDDRPLAWLQCYNADPVNESAAIAVARLDTSTVSLRMASAVALFLEYCFVAHRFRKLYFEVASPNLALFGSMIGDLLVEEGRLAGHLRVDSDGYCDLHILALWDFNWNASPVRKLLLDRA